MTMPRTEEPREPEEPHSALDRTRSKFAASIRAEKRWWNVFKKAKEGDGSDWWFASTGIP
jgi:uncharacterized protein YifE (UPF0438 family)|tara:strand:+ start:13230 stop:13409 length:180 start_codon:yes stop_codon:yes gene_type:complete